MRQSAVLAPMVAVARRLRLGVRLVALAVVLLIPTAVLAQAFISATNAQISFAAQERDGVAVVAPALSALAQTVAGEKVDLGPLTAAAKARPGLGLDQALAAVTSAQASASTPAGRVGLATALAGLITAAGNSSNLILDPDLDSFYVMDSLVVQLPNALVDGAQAAVGPTSGTAASNVAAQAVLAGGLASAAAGLASDADTAAKNTAMPGLQSKLAALKQAAGATTALQTTLASTLSRPTAADPRALARAASAAVTPTAGQLDALLQARIGRQSSEQQRILGITAASLVLGAWFAVAVLLLTRRDAARTVAAVDALAHGDLKVGELPDARDEFGDIGRALHAATTTLRETISTIGEHAITLAAASEQLSASSASIAEAAEQTTTQAGTVSVATHEVSTHINGLSAASTQFGASISEIAQNAAEAARVASAATVLADQTTQTVDQLGRSSAEITGVIQLIRAVAGQTNLLALNATIEAARAGEAGKGFAVVASEVKDLAQQTETATTDITHRITQIQSESAAAATAISQIGTVIAQISEFQTSIAGAVEEQNATASEISQQVIKAADSSAGITDTIAAVANAARTTSDNAGDSRTATQDLARMSAQLRTLVDQFQL